MHKTVKRALSSLPELPKGRISVLSKSLKQRLPSLRWPDEIGRRFSVPRSCVLEVMQLSMKATRSDDEESFALR